MSSSTEKKSSGATSMNLPENLIFEILSWLPAKKSTQLKTVSKSFFDIISCPYFQTMQATHVKIDTGLIIISFNDITSFEALFLTDGSGIPKDDRSLLLLKESSMRILASSHGLIFFETSHNNNLLMFNPVTKKHAEISPPKLLNQAPTNLCMHYIDGEDFAAPKNLCVYNVDGEDFEMIYVIRRSQCGPPSCKLMLNCRRYSSKDMSWEDISEIDAGCRIIQEEAVFVSGSIYWVSDTGICRPDVDPYLIEFNIEQRSSRVVVLPEQVLELVSCYYDIRVASWADGSLCLIQYMERRTMVIWVMSCSSENEWKKVDEIDMVDLGLGDGNQVIVDNYTLINGELLVICVRERIYGYNLSEGRMNMLGRHEQGRCPSLMPYANTFRSCGKFEQPIEACWL